MEVSMQAEPGEIRAGFPDLVRELLAKITELFTVQLELLKAEARAGGMKMARAATLALMAALIGMVFLQLLGLAFIIVLTPWFGLMAAVLVTPLLYLLAVGVCLGLMILEIRRSADDIEI